MTSSQHSGQSGASSCGNSVGYASWIPSTGVPPHPYNPADNFYNNPVQYTGSANPMLPHRCQLTPPGQMPPPLPSYYPPPNGTHLPPRNVHGHYPPSHSLLDYQPYNNFHNRKCGSSRYAPSSRFSQKKPLNSFLVSSFTDRAAVTMLWFHHNNRTCPIPNGISSSATQTTAIQTNCTHVPRTVRISRLRTIVSTHIIVAKELVAVAVTAAVKSDPHQSASSRTATAITSTKTMRIDARQRLVIHSSAFWTERAETMSRPKRIDKVIVVVHLVIVAMVIRVVRAVKVHVYTPRRKILQRNRHKL